MRDDGKHWVESTKTGDKGWLVLGTDPEKLVMPPFPDTLTVKVRLDRGNQLLLKRYDENDWRSVATPHPISEMMKARIAHAALRELAFAMGDHKYARRELLKMTDEVRIAFMRQGPKAEDPTAADDIRQELWDVIMEVLG